MEDSDLAYFKDLLTHKLNELLSKAENTMVGMRNSDNQSADPLDRAVIDSEHSFTLRIQDRERSLISKIKRSLDDIESGEYGICEDCGREISTKRLIARPVARRCIRCKTKQEKLEKVIGL
jgi:DnaK suppressor protein